MGGKFADEAHGIGEKEGQIVYYYFSHSGVERGEQLVLGEYIAFAQQVHERGFAHVGVAHQRHAGELAAVFALHGFLAVDMAQFLL